VTLCEWFGTLSRRVRTRAGMAIYVWDAYARTPARWLPEQIMPSCDHCGSHVSERFARVFSDEHGRLNACPSCSANAGIAEVARRRTRNNA
jgi:DNA-directed RNA polymerase subunit RPC12/RpoP